MARARDLPLDETMRAAVGAKVLASERAMIAAKAIVPTGWRLVGRRS